MELYLIRHAQSQNNALPEEQRVEDPGLTPLGHRQAELLGEWIPQLRLDELITSPFLRALETTRRIHEATGLTPHVRTAIHEQGGCYRGYAEVGMRGRPGMNRREIETRFPGFRVADEIGENGWWRCQDHETGAGARQRAAQVWQRTREEFGHTQLRVAYVMHADFKLIMLGQIHQEPLDVPWNTSIAKVVFEGDAFRLVKHNEIAHLPPELLSN